jgi:manganese/zinc/iron transport system permease protein
VSDFLEIFDVLLLRNYNTRLVVICTFLLGSACGLMGSFLLLRKRSLMGDTLSHATLPGVCLAFFVVVSLGGDGKSLFSLLIGASVTGVLGCVAVLFIRDHSRVKDDTAMGIVLSVFFGAGIVLLTMITKMPQGAAAGLESFIYGKTASMVYSDFKLLVAVNVCVLLLTILLFKEFRLLCFDEAYAAAQGWPTKWLDVVLLALVTTVTVAGLQSVGLILIIAFLIIPAAAARFWTDHLDQMLWGSALIGGFSGWVGSSVSALIQDMPAGSLIVLVAATFFAFSLLFGTRRGVLITWFHQLSSKRKIGRQHLLRALYEILEADHIGSDEVLIRPVPFRQIRGRRTWSDKQLRKYLRQAYNDGLIDLVAKEDAILLTEAGLEAAARITRNHRLWELYLIEYADVAASRVDRDADAVEHVLGEKLVALLEAKLIKLHTVKGLAVPASPHPITPGD